MNTNHSTDEDELPVSSYDRQLLTRLLGYLKPYRLVVAAALVLLIVNALLEISLTFLVQIGIDDYMATRDIAGFQTLALAYFGVILLGLATASGQLYLTMWLGQKVQHDIRTQLFIHLQRLPAAFIERTPVGRLVTRLTSDVSTLNELFSSGVVTILGDLLTLVLIIAALLYYNWQLALLTFAVLPLLVYATIWFRSRIRRQFSNIRVRLARLNSFVQEHVTGMEQVRLYGREPVARARLAGLNRRVRSASLKSVYYSALFLPTAEIIGALSIAVLLHAGGIRILDGVLTFGELVAFINLVERFYQPIQSLSEEYGVLQASMASSERMFHLLDTKPEEVIPVTFAEPLPQSPGIDFQHVWFAYAGEEWVLKDVSFHVAPGETVAIVGATGAGKTTLASLLFRFYDPQRGTISMAGHSLIALPRAVVRARLGLVPQDGFLFGGTIADNIRLGNRSIPNHAIEEALHAVGFHETGVGLPDGIDTPLNQGGTSLSSGQRQLLALARVLVHDPDVLVLDEATSAVDVATEQHIESALALARRRRTAIIIAHRLATVRQADRIIVMHHGEIRESGNHDQLLAIDGIYRKLYFLQFDPSHTGSRIG